MSETAKKTWLKDSSGEKLIPFTTEEMVLDAEGNQASLNYMKTGDVVANPTLVGTESALSGLEIDGTKYSIPETDVSSKMDKVNPTGTGSLSLNRKANTPVGTNSVTEGTDNMATAEAAHAEGIGTNATGAGAHAEGDTTNAYAPATHAEGYKNNATQPYAHVEGSNNNAYGQSSHAEGDHTTASALYAHAEGLSTTASNSAAHAEGWTTTASALYAHSEGDNTTASGQSSHAEGSYTKATSPYAHAEGYYSESKASYAHAEGWGTVANCTAQHVEGKYNIEDTSNKYAHIIGNGGDPSNRSDAFTVDWYGNVVATGDVTDGDGNVLSTVASTVTSNYADSVHVSTYEQGLTAQEKANARTNIEAVSMTDPMTDGKIGHNRNSNYTIGNNSIILSTATDSFATQSENIAIGSANQIQTEGAVAIGRQNYISGTSKWNIYIGRQLTDPGAGTPWNTLVLGTYNETGLGENAQFTIGAGRDGNNRMNAMNIYSDGSVSIGRFPAIHTPNDNSKVFVIGNGVDRLTRRNAMEIDSTNKTTFNGLVVAPNIPTYPSSDGVYKLTCTVVDGEPEWTWEAE